MQVAILVMIQIDAEEAVVQLEEAQTQNGRSSTDLNPNNAFAFLPKPVSH